MLYCRICSPSYFNPTVEVKEDHLKNFPDHSVVDEKGNWVHLCSGGHRYKERVVQFQHPKYGEIVRHVCAICEPETVESENRTGGQQ